MIAHRGEVWIVDFGDPIGREQAGLRPAVVVSADPLNESRAGVLIVVPCTTTPRGLASHIELETTSTGLEYVSYAKCEDVRSISDLRLVSPAGRISLDEGFRISTALRFLLDL